jgi:hypothetical protein
MATVKYFSGTAQVDSIRSIKNAEFSALFPGIRGLKDDGYHRWAGFISGKLVPITRRVFFKSNPSLHKCDARCLNATGHNCECSCGGKNHGAGNG